MKDQRDREKLTKAFTLVFEGDIRRFKMNPLATETPWGIPYAAGMGDAFEQIDQLEATISSAYRATET